MPGFSVMHTYPLTLNFSAWWISDRPHPPSTSPTLRDFLLSVITTSSSSASSDSFFVRLTSHPSWVALSSDIFKGQVIATLIVLTFVAMFLLREWISQNARPGIFEDDDLLEERERPVAQLQPQQQVQQQVHPPAAPIPTIPAIPPRMPLIDDSAETQQNVDGPNYLALDNHPIGDQPVDERGQIRRIVRRRPFAPQRNTGTGSTAQEGVSQSGLHVPARSRRRFGSGARTDGNITGDVQDPEVMRKRSFTRHLRAARMSGLERRLGAASLTSSSETDLGVVASRDFEFTFRSSARMPRRILSEHRIHRYHSADANAQLSSGPSAHFPAVQFEPPLSPIPFGLYRSVPNREELTTSSSLVPTLVNASLSDSALVPFSLSESDGDWVSSFPSSHESQQRPSLPEIDTSPRGSPSPSPNSTTYRAPEELEAGSSRATASVESESSSPDDERCEYFKESNENTEELENGSASAALDEKTTLPLLDSGEEDTEDDNEDGEETDDEPDDEPEGEDDDDDLDVLEGVGWEQGVEPRDDQPGRDRLGAADQAQQNDGELVPQEANDELEGNVEDDMEGAMEGARQYIFHHVFNAIIHSQPSV
jgi:E3 ubiquitin-protein ligase MARCH6